MPGIRVLLLNPPAYRGVRYVREGRCEQRLSSFQYNMLPISLPSTAALLHREGHQVRLLDATALNLSREDVVRESRDFSPDFILTNVSTPTFRGDAETAAMLKETLPRSFIGAFGVHVTTLPEESLQDSRLDGVIRREPEITAAELARALEKSRPLEKVPGLSYRKNWHDPNAPGPLVHNPERPFLRDLDSLPFPALDSIDHRLYPAPVSGRPHTLIVTSRGCPYHCVFCTAHLFYGFQLRLRDPFLIGEEIEHLHRTQQLDLFTFWADTFTLDRKHVVAICLEIQRRGLKIEWMCNSRVDRVDLELLQLMAASGCRVISYGVESGAQEILDNTKKGITVDQIVNAFSLTRQAGIRSAAHVILGLPGETTETIRETLQLVRRIRPDYVQFYGAIPFPGTAFHRQAVSRGWLAAKDWEDFEINNCIVSTPTLTASELHSWRRRAYLSFYLRPRYLAARLAEVRSPGELTRLASGGWSFLRGWVFS